MWFRCCFSLIGGLVGTTLSVPIRAEVCAWGGSRTIDSLYSGLITAHAVFRIFLLVMPALFGGFGNWLVPMLLGAPDMAFPRLNDVSFWLTPSRFWLRCRLPSQEQRCAAWACPAWAGLVLGGLSTHRFRWLAA